MARNEWKHRAKVYKFGVRWSWKCHRPYCHGGSYRLWSAALWHALKHTESHGCYVYEREGIDPPPTML